MNDLLEDDTYSIKSIIFHVEKDESIVECSAQENGVETSVLRNMDSEKVGGLVDHRLGSSNGEVCRLCKQQIDCITHPTYIDLGIYVINSYYYDVLHKILNIICLTCGKIIKDYSFNSKKEEMLQNISKIPKKKRLEKLLDITKKVKSCTKEMYGCSSDESDRPDVVKLKKGTFPLSEYEIYYGKRKDENGIPKEPNMLLGGKQLHGILKRISDTDWELMGFDPKLFRPENLMINILPIPARATRLTHVNDNSYSEDDLLIFERDIMKKVEDLRNLQAKGNEESKIERALWHLTFFVITHMNNTHSQQNRHKNSFARLRCIHQRLDKKPGLFRKNLSGKRVGLSARSVISGDPTISIDEVHIPRLHAMKLDYPVVVKEHNIKDLQMLVNAGPKRYPGANRVRIQGSRYSSMISLKYAKNHIELKEGHVVFRHLQDGDYVMVNRQPSLHKDSIQAHRVKVRKYGRTIGLSVIATEPYNADFDGDEMNIYAMHNMQSMIEIEHLASIKNNIMSTGKSKTNFGLNNDSLVGCYCLSQPGVRLDKVKTVKLLSRTNLPIKSLKRLTKSHYTGHEIISLILPKGLNYKRGELMIIDGVMVSGCFNKKSIGTGKLSIINTIYYLCGNLETMNFINNIQKISVEYLAYFGFSVGLRDIYVPPDLRKEKNRFMTKFTSDTNQMLRDIEIDVLKTKGKFDFEASEDAVFNKIRNMRSETGKLVQSYMESDTEVNNVMLMQLSGSKGKPPNLAQMSACVGQQEIFLNNKSIRVQRNCNGRIFAKYPKNDLRVEAGGNVISSFLEGMTSSEAYAHAYSGRVNMIDKGIGTADTGYIQRKLIKVLEGMMLYSDYTVRNANNQIVQMVSGSGCINPGDIVETSHEILTMNNKEVIEHYLPESFQKKMKLPEQLIQKEIKRYIGIRDSLRVYSQKYWSDRSEPVNKFYLPFNMKQLVEIKRGESSSSSKIKYETVLEDIEKLKSDPMMSIACTSMNEVSESKAMKIELAMHIQRVMYWFIDTYMAPKKIIIDYDFSYSEFKYILGEIKQRYIAVRQSPGELVGIIAAQTIGEPTTQMNLNAFHHAGTSGDNVSNLSLKRVKELMNLTDGSKLKAPQMKVYFKRSIRNDYVKIKKIANNIKSLFLKDIIHSTHLYYDPIGKFVEHVTDTLDAKSKPWVFVYTIHDSVMEDKNLEAGQIENGIDIFCMYRSNKKYLGGNKSFKKQFVGKPTIFTTKIDGNHQIHIRFKLVDVINNTLLEMSKLITEHSKIVGVDNITDVSIVTSKLTTCDEEGNYVQEIENFIVTDGVNLGQIIKLQDLDHSRLHCNDYYQVHKLIGIEAVRKMMFDEYRAIICSNEDINHYHIGILVDFCCHRAGMVAITASKNKGVNTLKIDPLTRASFEETTNMLMDSALYSEVDHMRFCSSSVIAGQTCRAGSGYCDLGLNYKLIEKYGSNQDFSSDKDLKVSSNRKIGKTTKLDKNDVKLKLSL